MESVFRTPQVHVIGEIVGAKGFNCSKLYGKFEFRAGESWRLLAGKPAGETFYDSSENSEGLAVFEHPFDLQYACRSIVGWPKIQMEIWSVDQHGRHTIAGYGVISIPCAPGQYMLQMPLWRPVGDGKQQSYSKYMGINPELQHKNMLISGNDRFEMRTYSTGTVSFRVGVLTKDFQLHGVKM